MLKPFDSAWLVDPTGRLISTDIVYDLSSDICEAIHITGDTLKSKGGLYLLSKERSSGATNSDQSQFDWRSISTIEENHCISSIGYLIISIKNPCDVFRDYVYSLRKDLQVHQTILYGNQ